ncbi:MAG: RagB/SusD family nutrient uptake outer membrane protein [Bacteroidales bacterium]|nr:RagB/SusD family nutrient uptake outer membrane protein [Bacteroidales bacterium]
MKKYISIIVMILSILACEDYLEEKSVTKLTQSFYNTTEGLETLAKGSYQVLRFKPDYNQGHYLFGVGNDAEVFIQTDADRIAMGSYSVDAWGPDASGNRMTPQVTPLLGWMGGNWSEGMYPVINRCNLFLEKYAGLSETDKIKIQAAKGEMLFFRAYSYYLLTNVLGDVPLILESFEGLPSNFYFAKAPMEDIYKLMIGDLRNAIDLLPATINPTTELGRLTKPAAAHLLAKMYLNRAQAAGWQNSAETHLKMLYKGNVATDLDSAIFYATFAIEIVKANNPSGIEGLEKNFGSLWKVDPTATSMTGLTFSRDNCKEIILSAQYEPTQTYNGGRYGNVLVHIYNSDHTVLRACTPRNMMYGRPYRALGPSEWAYEMYTDRANDSRYYKTYLTDYESTAATNSGGKPWDEATAYYFNSKLWNPNSVDEEYRDSAIVNANSKIKSPGYRSIVYIENKKEEPLDSLFVVSQPYIMMVRWMVGSPNRAGYFTKDATGKITGFKPGADVDPANPVVTDTAGRKLMYRVSGDKGTKFGIDNTTSSANWLYLCPKKWLDRNRGLGVTPNNPGAIDVPLMRLAETYLIRAEAYGRKGNFVAAIDDINILRQRAAYHPGESRSDVLASLEPGVITGRLEIPAAEKVYPYTVTTDSYEKIRVTGEEWQAGTERAKLENYPLLTGDGRSLNDLDRFIHFIYNEKAREMIFELQHTEDLHNAGILYERIYYREMMGAPPTSTGTPDFPFPVDAEDLAREGVTGAKGVGKGQLSKHHTFKAWPSAFLIILTDENNNALTQEEIDAYQNPGY